MSIVLRTSIPVESTSIVISDGEVKYIYMHNKSLQQPVIQFVVQSFELKYSNSFYERQFEA